MFNHKNFLIVSAAVMAFATQAQTLQQSFYFDFGPKTGTSNGVETTGADSNGNYWNNITNNSGNYIKAESQFGNLVNSKNETTSVGVTFVDRFTTNGAGGFTKPEADKLGDFAISSATTDYLFIEKSEDESVFTITGLDATKAYKFTVFASRSSTQTRTGIYTISGYNTVKGELQAAGTNLGGTGVNQNASTVLVTDYAFPASDGTLNFMVSRKTGDYIPVNCMKIEEYSDVKRPQLVKYESLGINDGSMLQMTELKEHQFELWTELSGNAITFSATTDKGETVVFGSGDTAGKLYENGSGIAAAKGPSRIIADLDALTYSILPVESVSIIGSVTPGGWNLSSSIAMEYKGNMVYNYKGLIDGKDTNSDPGRFNFVVNKSWSNTLKRVGRTDKISLTGSDDIKLNPGNYDITVNLAESTFTVANGLDGLDPMRITVMGSSVANGQGADPTGNGYAYLYGQQLQSRYEGGESKNDFYVSNISINGNSTVNLLERYDELQREFGKYVIYGVSLGNEGIHGASDQQKIYDQFKNNMGTLIANARNDGKYAIVMNNYTRGDFEASDYDYVKRMDEEIEQWDCPSIDLLGAIDNGAGRWADGYMAENASGAADIYHPNMAGHQEFMYAMVPSMMDAIASGKELAMNRTKGKSMLLGNGGTVEFSPEGTTHPFTLSFSFSTVEQDLRLATVSTADGNITVDLTADGLLLTLADNRTVAINGAFADGNMHTVFLSHHYAQGTVAFATGTGDKQTLDNVKIAPTKVVIGDTDENKGNLSLGELMFYRSGKIGSEGFFNGDKLYKSSIEIYVPFDEAASEQKNLAMSLNEVKVNKKESSGVESVAAGNSLTVCGKSGAISITAATPTSVKVSTTGGCVVYSELVDGNVVIDNLLSGIYLVNNRKVVVK